MFRWWEYFFSMLISALISSSSSCQIKQTTLETERESVEVKPTWRETGNRGGCLRSYPCDIHDLDRSELAGLNMPSLKRER